MRLRPNFGVLLWRERIRDAENAVMRGQDALAIVPTLFAKDEVSLTAFAKTIATMTLDERIGRALDVMHASGGRIGIAELAECVGCSTRHLNRIFRSCVGLSAKTYAQLVQFHRTLKLLQQDQHLITDAAYEGGYADHAHLTRSFRRFGGFVPSDIPKELSLPALFG